MQIYEFYIELEKFMRKVKGQRKGQAAYNLMLDIFPEKARKYAKTNLDPFYNDDKIAEFIAACLGDEK